MEPGKSPALAGPTIEKGGIKKGNKDDSEKRFYIGRTAAGSPSCCDFGINSRAQDEWCRC